MKKYLLTLAAAVLALTAAAQVPAFPGAEGHGRYTTGGRGGQVIHVTNLNDSGKGSFREAVKGSTKKIIVFDVAGVIAMNSNISIGSNTTILGQTAPAPGITLRYYTLSTENSSNIIVRFLRFRRGQERDVNDGADAATGRHSTGIIFDHCSFSWSIDEVASFYDNNNFTMQWCTIGESLNNAGHGKGAHGYGGIWGGKLASLHHNLICHVNNRSPRFNGARYDWTGYTNNLLYNEYKWENAVQAENVDYRNCVVYNADGCYGGPGGGKINMVGNYLKSGPAANISKLTQVTVGASGNASGFPIYWDMTSRYYVEGNIIDGKSAGWEKFKYDDGTIERNGKRYSKDPNHYNGSNEEYLTVNNVDYICMKLDNPGPAGEVTTHTAENAFNKVLEYSGASLYPDEVDLRYFTEAKNGTATYTGSVTKKKGRIDLVSDVKGYTEKDFGTGSREAGFDSDGDGIPNVWETANGLNPNDASDAMAYTIDPAKYYSNIEVYANSLVQDIMLNGNADAIDAAKEYYPAYKKEDGTAVALINTLGVELSGNTDPGTNQQSETVNYTLAQSTNSGNNTSSSYEFNDGITITNTKSKGYAGGNNDGIKYSAGVQYTINLPEDVAISKIDFTGYDNYADVDAYLSEVAGISYEPTQYVFPQKVDGAAQTVTRTIDFSPAVGEKITFTPQGKQVVLSISLTGTKGGTTGIRTIRSSSITDDSSYNLAGQRVDGNYKGIVIRNGKKMIQK